MKKVLVIVLAGLLLVMAGVASFADKPGTTAVGATILSINGVNAGAAAMKYYFTKSMAGNFAAGLSSVSSTTIVGISGGVTNDFYTDEKLKGHWGGNLVYCSFPGANTFSLQGILGAECMITPKFSFTVDIMPIALTLGNSNGSSSTMIQLGAASSILLSSFHFYL